MVCRAGASDLAAEYLEAADAGSGSISPLLMGRVHWGLGRITSAAADYQKAVALGDGAKELSGIVRTALKPIPNGISDADEILGIKKLMQQERNDEAAAHFNDLLKRAPTDTANVNAIATLAAPRRTLRRGLARPLELTQLSPQDFRLGLYRLACLKPTWETRRVSEVHAASCPTCWARQTRREIFASWPRRACSRRNPKAIWRH